MYVLNNVRQTLILLLISQKFYRAELLKNPVCIIGAGISGLSAAHRLKEKGYSVKVFEKNSVVGGKMHTFRKDGVVWNMGPVIFNGFYKRTLDIVDKYKIKYETTHFLDVSGYQPDIGLKILLPQQLYDKSTKETWAHYRKIRKSLTIETGLVKANPELFVSTSEWLKANKLESLKMHALILLTSEVYGHIDGIPALYFVHLMDISKETTEDVHRVLDGMDQIPIALAKDLDIKLNAQVAKIDRSENAAKVTYLTNSGSKTQECSSVIVAFTPLYNHVSSIILDLSAEEREILKQVKIHKYATIANYATYMKYFAYLPLLPPPFPPKLDGGRPCLISNQTRGGAVSYHWTKGNFDVGPTDEELSLYQSENDKIIPKLFPSNDTKTNIYVKGWDYFPHVTTESLQDGFYSKFYSIQGKGNVYYAIPLLGFELIEYSIRAGEYVADYFY